jgi:hypothetical protein
MFHSWLRAFRSAFSGRQAPGKRRQSSYRHSAAGIRPHLELLEDRTLPTTFLVTTTADSGPGSLRQAILDANQQSVPAVIDFDIPLSEAGATGAFTIQPTSPLPNIVGQPAQRILESARRTGT